MELSNQYLSILEIANGLQWNGFVLYDIDSAFLGDCDDNAKQNNNGLIAQNELWDEVLGEAQNLIFYGDSSISLFACELKSGRFVELDKPSGDEVEAFDWL